MPASLTCTRRLAFDAAHRIPNHESKCKYVHGHRYEVEATFAARGLDELGRIVDFGVVKERLGGWLDVNWDHTAILSEHDRALGEAMAGATGQKIYYMPVSPTAENLADYLLKKVCPVLFADAGVECVGIRVWETPNCFADASA